MTKIQLADFCDIVQGGRLGLTGSDLVEAGFPAYGAGGVNGCLPNFEFDREAVVLSAIGARCGKCFYARGKWSSLANTQLIFPDPTRADAKFLWFQLNDEAQWPRSGTGQPFIKPSDVKRHMVYLPPLTEQRRLAAILDEADNLRRSRRIALDKLMKLPQAIFHDMFGPVRTRSRGFPVRPLGDIISVSSGNGLTKSQLVDGPFPVYGGNGINGYHSDFMVSAGTIVIGRVGAYCGAVHVTKANSWVTDNALIVSRKNDDVLPAYLSAALVNANLNQYAGRSAQPLISGGRLYPIAIPVPPLAEQELFALSSAAAEATSETCLRQSRSIDELFSSLRDRTFNGDL